MAFVVLGVILLVLKLVEWMPVANWSWWLVLGPFGIALAWWSWKDASGMTRRQEMDKDNARKEERRRRNIEAMGLAPDAQRKGRGGKHRG
jgi:small Trp-rich protein